MEDMCSGLRRWEDMDIDVLVKIFQNLNILELISSVGHVCSTWRLAACDPLLWKRLDLSMLRSNFIKIPLEPYVYVDGRSDKKLTSVMKIALNLSRRNVLALIFHYSLYVSDDQLTYAAERCPLLKRLVMPAPNRIKKTGMCQAVRSWVNLESLTLPGFPLYLMEEVAKNCKNFSELKVTGACDINFANTLVTCLPNLKVLSLRCSMVFKDALLVILESARGLEVLNISHCVLVENCQPPVGRKVLKELDRVILEKASRLKTFLTCMSSSCIMCQRAKDDEGLMRWYKYEEDLWKEDEIASLAV